MPCGYEVVETINIEHLRLLQGVRTIVDSQDSEVCTLKVLFNSLIIQYPNIIRKYFIFFALFSVQVPLRKTNINGRGAIPPVPDDQTRFTTGIGTNVNAMRSMNSYPQHPHLMTTTMTRTNGADGFTTTTKPGKNDN